MKQKQKKQFAWKVVRDCGHRLAGTYVPVENYKRNQWTRPTSKQDNPFLFVFATRKDARRYKRGISDYVIFKCEVRNMTHERRGYQSFGGVEFSASNMFLFPFGTRFVDAVKLLNRVR